MILLTGFGPYSNYTSNISGEIVKKFAFKDGRFQITREILPVNWERSIIKYKSCLSTLALEPELIILLGIHSNRNFHLEKLGWNFKFGEDTENKFGFGPIRLTSTPWIKTTLNLDKVYRNLKDRRKISISYFPGFYLCNYLYYLALYLSRKKYPVIFIHVPDKGDILEYINKFKMIFQTIIRTHFEEKL